MLPENPVRGAVLKAESGSWVSRNRRGNHRLSVGYVIGLKNVPVPVDRMIYRAGHADWAGVRNGIFTKEGSLKILNNIVAGDF